jgi:hypothetical protein
VTERPVTSQAQAIERMIQDEIMQFTSIEDLEKMTFKAVAESNPLDQHPAFGGEDPRDWASEMGMEDEGGDHTRMDLSPFEKDGLGYREGRSLDQILEGPGESTETLAQQTLEVPAPAPIQARRTVPPPPPAGKQAQKAADAARSAAEQHRPAGPQAAARPAGKTPLPPPGSGPKRTADGKPIPGTKPGPKPFVVKPNVGKPITIKPQAEAPPPVKPEPKKPVAGKKTPKQESPARGKDRPAPKKNATAKSSSAKPGGKAAADKRHSSQLARRKPR